MKKNTKKMAALLLVFALMMALVPTIAMAVGEEDFIGYVLDDIIVDAEEITGGAEITLSASALLEAADYDYSDPSISAGDPADIVAMMKGYMVGNAAGITDNSKTNLAHKGEMTFIGVSLDEIAAIAEVDAAIQAADPGVKIKFVETNPSLKKTTNNTTGVGGNEDTIAGFVTHLNNDEYYSFILPDKSEAGEITFSVLLSDNTGANFDEVYKIVFVNNVRFAAYQYKATFGTGDYTIAAYDTYDEDNIMAGEDFKFTVTPDDGYGIGAVEANGEVLTAVDGVYTAEAADITGDFTIDVTTGELVDHQPEEDDLGTVDLSKDVVVTFPGEWNDKIGIYLNGELLLETGTGDETILSGYPGYTANDGKLGEAEKSSVKVTLYKDFLNWLPDGEYTLVVEFDDGVLVGSGTLGFNINRDATMFTLTATAGENGTITPKGAVSVAQGESQTFVFKPADGYKVDKVTVNGTAVAAKDNKYTVANVQANGTIHVTFVKVTSPETGDSSNIFMLIALMMLSGAAVAITMRKKASSR